MAEDIEKLKNRREERKKNLDDAKKQKSEGIQINDPTGKTCDIEFENLIKKKKKSLLINPDNVQLF